MTPILIAGPAAEPVSLAEAKSWLKVDTNEEDDLIGALVTSARLIVESLTRRMLMTQTWRLVLDRWDSGLVVRIPFAPFRSLGAIRVYDAANAPQTLSQSLYTLDASPDKARLLFAAPPPTPGRSIAGIEIDVVLGYGGQSDAVPAALRQAIRHLTAKWFEDRGDALSDPASDALPASVIALLAPYRRVRLA